MSEQQAQAAIVETTQSVPPSTSLQFRYASPRLFGRQRTVHEILGGGNYADILMWKRKHVTGGILLGATVAYILFEWCGYTLLSIVSNALLFLVVILFTWSNAAALLDRSPPPIPEIQLSEEMVESIAQTLRLELNRALGIVHVIALGKDLALFFEVIGGLWIFSLVGGWCHFLTLSYCVLLLLHTGPVLYDKYEDDIDKCLELVAQQLKQQYRKVDNLILRRIPRPRAKKDE